MLVALLAIALALGACWFLRLQRRNLPPGPWGLPVLGYLPWLDPVRPHETLTNLAKRYGPIYSISMGSVLTVVLSDEKLVRTAFAREEYAGRAPLYLTHGLMKGYGIICAEGELWRDQRRLVASTLKNLGAVKSGPRRARLEKRILTGVNVAVKSLREAKDAHATLTDAVGNVVNDVVLGRTWESDDSTWLWLQHIQDEGAKLIGVAGPINFLPFLRIVPRYSRSIQWLKEGQQAQHALYADLAKAQAAQTEVDDHILAAWLNEKRSKQEHDPDRGSLYSDCQLQYLLCDLFGAGLDTTVTTLRWLLLYLAAYPEIQDRMYSEIHSCLGDRPLSLEDMDALPYTQAVIAETQRIRSVTPVGIPHGTCQDTVLDGYHVPKGTMVVPLQWAIHMDPKRWPEPETFRPERFLAQDGSFARPEGFIPFQTGKRMCVGEEWARMMLFLFGAGIVHQLQMSTPDGEELDLEGICGITLTPKHYNLLCTPRVRQQ